LQCGSILPVEVVFSPAWWHKRCGITFDRTFFFDADRRVEDEQTMRRELAALFPDLGLGQANSVPEPVIGAVHLASGYFIAEALGCQILYHDAAPPDVIPMGLDYRQIENWKPPVLCDTKAMVDFEQVVTALKARFGCVTGDVNWSGVQNTALDLRGMSLFTDYYDRPDVIRRFLDGIAEFILSFVQFVKGETRTSSVSVNRSVIHVDPSVNLHSNCSVTMISADVYEEFLLPFDQRFAAELEPYGIHHCGRNADELAESYAKVEGLCFVDVGWGSDLARCRKALPNAFLNIRLSPARMATCSPDDIREDVRRLARDAGRLDLIGFCCVNLDDQVSDENVRALFAAVSEIRDEGYV